ncbi:MAG: LLM class flavin-dependent oxidoreductase [Nitrospinota bacterium]
MALTLGIRLPPSQPPAEGAGLAAEVERAGFEAAWVTDTPLLAGRWGDSYVYLSAMAMRTERLRVGTAVTNPYMRHFQAVAAACASLHDLSGGRFVLGIGAGASAARSLGLPGGKLGRLREFVRALRLLLREGEAEFGGRRHELVPPRPVPLYVAAMGPQTIEFAGAEADGVILQVGANRKTIARAMGRLRAGAEGAGRDVSAMDVVISAQCCALQDRDAAIRRMRHLLVPYYYLTPEVLKVAGLPGEFVPLDTKVYPDLSHALNVEDAGRASSFIPDEVVESLGIIGTPEEWVERLRMMEGLGVNHVLLRGPESYAQPMDEIAFCRNAVLPRLREALRDSR